MIFNQQPPSSGGGGGSSAATHSVTCQENDSAVFYVWDSDTSNWATSTTGARTGDYVLVKTHLKTPIQSPSHDSRPYVYDNNDIRLIEFTSFISLGSNVNHTFTADNIVNGYSAFVMPDKDVSVKNIESDEGGGGGGN